jgi:phosphonate transport system substrate-binding protein
MQSTPRLALLGTETQNGALFAELSESIRTSTGLSLAPVFSASYEDLFARVSQDPETLCWAPPLLAHQLTLRGLAKTLVVAARRGRPDYYATLVTFAGDEVPGMAALRRARVGWVSKLSVAGYGLPRLYLRSLGMEPNLIFGSQSFFGSHEAVASALLRGDIDVGATYGHLGGDGKRVHLDERISDARILALAGPIPADAILTGAAIDDRARETLRRGFLAARIAPDGQIATRLHVERFDPVPLGHLDPIRRWTERARGLAIGHVVEARSAP